MKDSRGSPRGLLSRTPLRWLGWEEYQWLMLAITVAIFFAMSLLLPERFPTAVNISSMAFQVSELGILSVAMALAMLIGGIDLSVNAMANLSAILGGIVLKALAPEGSSLDQVWAAFAVAAVVALGAGAVAGFFNGFLIGRLGVPAILATLSTLTLYTGLALGITRGAAVSRLPEAVVAVGSGSLLGVPVPFLVFAAVLAAVSIFLAKTRSGFKMYLLGTNAKAARFSGFANDRIVIKTHMITGLLSALTGLVSLARTNSANADYGSSYVLMAILVAVLGGVSVTGGKGKISGIFFALLALQFLSTGFNMFLLAYNGSNFFRDFIWGFLLLAVMTFNYYFSARARRSRRGPSLDSPA